MQKQRRRFFYLALSSIGALALVVVLLFSTFLQHPATPADAASAINTMPLGMKGSVIPMRPMYKMAVKMGVGSAAQVMNCLQSTTLPLCYSPQQIQTAYGAQPLLAQGNTGKGRIITIIDAFQDPTVRQDLQLFDKLFGLNDPQLNILAPFGLTPFNPNDANQVGFAGEIALDVEWAHAMAPGATIDLVLANVKQETIQGQLSALLQAVNFAVQNSLGSVISQSFGIGEGCLSPAFIQQAHRIYRQASTQKQTVFASAGDSGAASIQCNAQGKPAAIVQGVNYPASDPFVTSVGGTTLLAAKSGAYISETAWNDSQQGHGATGGGVSKVFPLPNFQKNIVQSQTRAVSDISFDADPLTGVPVVTSTMMPGKTVIIPVGGTSVGSPLAAGMVALLDQAAGGKRLGFLNTAFYRISQNAAAYANAFHDVQTGNNTFIFQQNKQVTAIPGFPTARGWDAPTGVGSPNAAQLSQVVAKFIAGA